MAASFTTHPDPNEILRASGYWYLNPTDLSSESTWGTRLGYTKSGARIWWNEKVVEYNGVIRGVEPIAEVYCGCNVKVETTLRNYNSSVLGVAMPGRFSSTAIRVPGSIAPGTLKSSSTYTNVLLYVPDDKDNKPCCLIRKAMVNVKKTTDLTKQREISWALEINALTGSGTLDNILFLGLIAYASL